MLKLSGVQFFIDEIYKNMNYIDLNIFSNIRANLQALFQFYCEQMGTTELCMGHSEVQQIGVGEWDVWVVFFSVHGHCIQLKLK